MKNIHTEGISLDPINKKAATVTQTGIHFNSRKRLPEGYKHWKTQPPLRKSVPHFLRYLLGRTFGRFTVVGLSNETKKQLWVVRCSCGSFETRWEKAIRNPKNSDDCCSECRHLEYLQKMQRFQARGGVFDKSE